VYIYIYIYLELERERERELRGLSNTAVKREREREREEMILVAIVAEFMEEYTVLLARVLEHLFHSAPFPRRFRFLILHSLSFASPPRLAPA
jgi:hypothetical protein